MTVEKIFNSFNETDKQYLMETMTLCSALCINPAPENVTEFKKWCEEVLTDRDESIAKEKAKKEKKAQKEIVKANELNMNLDTYREYQKMVNNKKRHEREKRKAENEIARLKKVIKAEQEKIIYYDDKIAKIKE